MRTLQNAIEHDQVRQAYLFAGPRGTGKTSMARILAKALNCAGTPGPSPTPGQDVPRLPRDRERQLARRRRDGRRLAARDRRHPRDPRARRPPAGRGPLQGLHPRRGAPAHRRRMAGAPQAHRGASSPPRVRLLHDRAAEGARDRALALPDVRLPAAAAARARHAAAARRRRRGDPGAGLGALADRARRARLVPRRGVDARPARRVDERTRSTRSRCSSSSARSTRSRCCGCATWSSTATRPARCSSSRSSRSRDRTSAASSPTCSSTCGTCCSCSTWATFPTRCPSPRRRRSSSASRRTSSPSRRSCG